jgi:hypothetical protein
MVYTQKRNAKLMMLMILTVWCLSALISIPPLFGWGRPSFNLKEFGMCVVSQDFRYQIYATLLAFYIPLLVMIIIYINIYRAARKIKKKEMKTCGTLKFNSDLMGLKRNQRVSVASNGSNNQQQHLKMPLLLSPSNRHPSKNSLSPMSSAASSLHVLDRDIINTNLNASNTSFNNNRDLLKVNNPNQLNFRERFNRRMTTVLNAVVRRSSSSSASGKNQKATRTLGTLYFAIL